MRPFVPFRLAECLDTMLNSVLLLLDTPSLQTFWSYDYQQLLSSLDHSSDFSSVYQKWQGRRSHLNASAALPKGTRRRIALRIILEIA
jgi:hypothetical protein